MDVLPKPGSKNKPDFELMELPSIAHPLGTDYLGRDMFSRMIYGLGTVNYFGDIGGAESAEASALADLDFAYTRPNLSVGYRYKVADRIAVKGNLTYASFKGSDVGSKNEGRNYTFTTNVFELYGHVEYHITPEKQMVKYSKMSFRGSLEKFNAELNVYVFVGLGAAYFKPEANDVFNSSNRFIDNKNLTFIFPMGLGVKYPLTGTTYIGFELGGRFTTTDYIDGFKPEASKSNDLYYISVIYVSHKIKRKQRRRKMRF